MDDLEKVEVFIEVLNKYLYFMKAGCEQIPEDIIGNLRNVIEELIKELEDETEEKADAIRTFYRNTIKYIDSGDSTED